MTGHNPLGVGADSHRNVQNCLGNPACLSTMFAQCRDLILLSIGKRRVLTGLYQIS